MEFQGALGAGVFVINARVVMLNEDSFHDLKAVWFIIAIYYSSLVNEHRACANCVMSSSEVFFRATGGQVHGKATGQGGGGVYM